MSVLSHKSPPPPCAIVIFGANGDLTRRLIIPALYNLVNDGLLPDAFAIVGIGRSPLSEDEFRQHMTDDLRLTPAHNSHSRVGGAQVDS